ncbi:MAG: response regulator [Patescibacteria group bacterium]|nr:response regulator [Patescibacteria group bacterium]MDE1946097.1 response regulator [Patescibacteria group bacterium]
MKNILVIEDDKFVGDMYERLFTMHGYAVTRMENGQAALDYLSAAKDLPAIMILDVHMSEMDGREFLKKIKKDARIQSVPVIVLTNSFFEEDKQAFLDLGAAMFLIKIDTSNAEILENVKKLIK